MQNDPIVQVCRHRGTRKGTSCQAIREHSVGCAAQAETRLEIASRLDDLKVPPGNRLEALKGGRIGHYSIRINRQWRICFRWAPAGAEDVEIVDYH